MLPFPQDFWRRVEDKVSHDKLSGANDEFNELKNLVSKASQDSLAAEAAHAGLAWDFLVGFAEKKAMYRAQIAKVVSSLMAIPSWQAAFAAEPDLATKVQALHPDLQAAFTTVVSSAGRDQLPTQRIEPPANTLPSSGAKWPDWAALKAVVDRDGYAGAQEEFNALRLAVKTATDIEIQALSANAALGWTFLIHFGVHKRTHRTLVMEVIRKLAEVAPWKAAFVAMPELHAVACSGPQEFHQDLQACIPEIRMTTNAESDEPRLETNARAAEHMDSTQSHLEHLRAAMEGSAEPPEVRTETDSATAKEASMQSHLKHLRAAMEGNAESPEVRTDSDAAIPEAGTQTDEAEAEALLSGSATGSQLDSDAAGPESGPNTDDVLEQRLAAFQASTPVSREVEPSAQFAVGGSSEASDAPSTAAAAPEAVPDKAGPAVTAADDGLVKRMKPYLQRADEVESFLPVVSHYCRVHVAEALIREKQRHELSSESKALLYATLQQAENSKAKLDLSNGRTIMEGYACKVYEQAIVKDAPPELYLASLYFDVVLTQFHGEAPSNDLEEALHYAKSRAVQVRSCQRQGLDPGPPAPPGSPVAIALQAAAAVASAPPVEAPPAFVPEAPPASAPVAMAGPVDPQPLAAPAAPPVTPQPATPAIAALAAPPLPAQQPAVAPAIAAPVELQPVPAGWSRIKRQQEAKKRTDEAVALLEHGDGAARAAANIREALHLLEGLG